MGEMTVDEDEDEPARDGTRARSARSLTDTRMSSSVSVPKGRPVSWMWSIPELDEVTPGIMLLESSSATNFLGEKGTPAKFGAFAAFNCGYQNKRARKSAPVLISPMSDVQSRSPIPAISRPGSLSI